MTSFRITTDFFFCCMVRLGYGNWELIQQAIQQCPQFRFDMVFP